MKTSFNGIFRLNKQVLRPEHRGLAKLDLASRGVNVSPTNNLELVNLGALKLDSGLARVQRSNSWGADQSTRDVLNRVDRTKFQTNINLKVIRS